MEFLMSKKTRNMQKQLMKALAVQAVIPLFVSFLPCLITLYQPVFNVNLGKWISSTSCVAISFFPVLDPLALFYFIPTFRRRIREAVNGKERPQLAVETVETSRGSLSAVITNSNHRSFS